MQCKHAFLATLATDLYIEVNNVSLLVKEKFMVGGKKERKISILEISNEKKPCSCGAASLDFSTRHLGRLHISRSPTSTSSHVAEVPRALLERQSLSQSRFMQTPTDVSQTDGGGGVNTEKGRGGLVPVSTEVPPHQREEQSFLIQKGDGGDGGGAAGPASAPTVHHCVPL